MYTHTYNGHRRPEKQRSLVTLYHRAVPSQSSPAPRRRSCFRGMVGGASFRPSSSPPSSSSGLSSWLLVHASRSLGEGRLRGQRNWSRRISPFRSPSGATAQHPDQSVIESCVPHAASLIGLARGWWCHVSERATLSSTRRRAGGGHVATPYTTHVHAHVTHVHAHVQRAPPPREATLACHTAR